jgi:sodium pump decarboxylase gamma subunit
LIVALLRHFTIPDIPINGKENNGMNSNLLLLADNVIHTSDKNLSGETIAAVVITGIAVVFIGLILLILLVWLYGKIFEKINKKSEEKKAAAQAVKNEEASAAKTAPAPIVEDGIDEEITAVIAAAIAAYGAQTGKKLAVRSIRKSGGEKFTGRNAWSSAGLNEATRPF